LNVQVFLEYDNVSTGRQKGTLLPSLLFLEYVDPKSRGSRISETSKNFTNRHGALKQELPQKKLYEPEVLQVKPFRPTAEAVFVFFSPPPPPSLLEEADQQKMCLFSDVEL
jgi:hypothetical protein